MAGKVKNKKFKIIAVIEAILILVLAVPLVRLSKLSVKS